MAQNNENERLQQAAEEYVDNYYTKLGTTQSEHLIDAKISKDDFVAGAQWQKEQYMDDISSAEDHAYFAGSEYGRKDAIKNATTEELKAELKRRVELSKEEYADTVNDNVRSKLPSNLEDAAIRICADILKGETFIVDGYECVVMSGAEDCFEAGAKWMASQGLTVEGDSDNGLSDESYLKLDEYFKSLPKETKVILQIRKV